MVAPASELALNIDGAIASMTSVQANHTQFQPERFRPRSHTAIPTPIEIGNVQGGNVGGGRRFNRNNREMDRDNKACFTYPKPGCRPWKHRSNNMNHGNTGSKRAQFHNINAEISGEKQEN